MSMIETFNYHLEDINEFRGWAETKQFLFILKIYNNDKYPKQNQIGAKYVSTLYSTAKYQIKVF